MNQSAANTLAQVNKEIARYGIKMVHGDHYNFFIDTTQNYVAHTISRCRVDLSFDRDITADEWVQYVKSELGIGE